MLTRRQLLQLGLAAGTLPLASRPARAARRLLRRGASPPTTPFVMPLPLPPDAARVRPFRAPGCQGPPPYAFAQPPGANNGVYGDMRFDYGSTESDPPGNYYRLVEEEADVVMHPDLGTTSVWRFRDVNQPPSSGVALGPTFRLRVGEKNIVRVQNDLDPNHVGFGRPWSSMHLHGGHQESRSDGFPDSIPGFEALFGPGQWYDYCYHMLDPGFSTGAGDEGERPSTLWYHDHTIDFTAQNVARGLAGMLVVNDDLDSGDESSGLRLPSKEFDLPLAIYDRQFDLDGSIFYDPFNHVGYFGDRILVNGAVQPYHGVKRRKYRLRILNASNSRFYMLFLADGMGNTYTFHQIAQDGSLLSAPRFGIDRLFLAPAERAEIVIDFSAFPDGASLYLEDRMDQTPGVGPTGTFLNPGVLPSGPQILRFDVQGTAPDPSQVPALLRPFSAITPSEVAAAPRQTFEFRRYGGMWTINLQVVDPQMPITTVPMGEGQVWTIRNLDNAFWHPVHIHQEFMRVLSRNGGPVAPWELDGRAKKDIVVLGPQDEVEVYVKFRDYKGPFVFHCHNLEHEDMAMMARFDVV